MPRSSQLHPRGHCVRTLRIHPRHQWGNEAEGAEAPTESIDMACAAV